ncbi:arylphorin subunit beta-like [Manduca sexta]|uniref:arylphorin subunit beta-like n=1 Tax=Manduca sexta TaxID=7130 RepID=UPI00188E3EED|nr:arylphorin subunit beta-like [Manduca sexta]
MKALTIVVTFLVGTSGYLIKVPTGPSSNNAPPQWMHLQKLVLPLFENVCEDSSDPVIIRTAQEFTSELTTENYWKPDALPNFQKLKNGKGFLPKGEIFTEYNIDHLSELEVIYDILYYAKNFDIFFKGAAWARQNLNCGLYLDAIYLAIANRKDTERLVVPAPYELLPNYFIRKDVILEGTKLAGGVNIELSEGVHVEGNAYQLDANYTSIFYDNNDESKLAYFREDIGLNSYYFIRKLKQAPWFNIGIDGRYGEDVYQMMKQFMARYNLERYANGLPELESWAWNDPTLFDVPYDPMLIYTNGNEFISRPSPVQLPDNEDVALLQTIENNIGTVVSHMRDAGYNKTQILNHLMEILVTGDRSYETLARQLLGKAHSDNGCPSVLEHYMTSLRDPIFWKMNKKIVDMVDEALKLLPSYARNELYFPGVEVINVDVKKVMTFYDYFEFDATDALKSAADNSTYQIKIAQPRLNHRPFSIKINVSSLVTQRGVVKVYLGPKILPGELAKKKNSFVLLDRFEYRFKIGSNIISRTSDDMKHFSEDFMSLRNLRKKVEDAEFGLDSLPLKTVDSQIGYPARLILPRGTMKGVPLQIFVFVAPYAKYSTGVMHSLKSMEFNKAIMSPGYPLDLVVQDKQLFELPNAMVKEIVVTHKGEGKVENYGGPGVTKKWYGTDTYDPSSKPNYDGNRKKPFDYSAKKGQYGKKEDSTEFKEYESKEREGFMDSFEENYDLNDDEDLIFKLGSTSFDYATKESNLLIIKQRRINMKRKIALIKIKIFTPRNFIKMNLLLLLKLKIQGKN